LVFADRSLGAGERAAIALAEELSADALLIDERDGRREAERCGLPVLGTLRVLADAAEHGLADLHTAFDRLRQTNFRASEQLLQSLLARDPERRRTK
jgi:predicted nucleic acid-binding protein